MAGGSAGLYEQQWLAARSCFDVPFLLGGRCFAGSPVARCLVARYPRAKSIQVIYILQGYIGPSRVRHRCRKWLVSAELLVGFGECNCVF